MDSVAKQGRGAAGLVAAIALLGLSGATGCQVDVAGQTLPSGYYLSDDVQYYAPGPEFKLAREAAALKAQGDATASHPQGCCP